MPTPGGKPKVGERILVSWKDKTEIWPVLKRGTGWSYSVLVRKPNGQEEWITEFDWWMQQRGWKILPPEKV